MVADETPIDELISAWQTGRAVLRIHAEIEGSGYPAIADYQYRYARLVRERPNDFILDDRAAVELDSAGVDVLVRKGSRMRDSDVCIGWSCTSVWGRASAMPVR